MIDVLRHIADLEATVAAQRATLEKAWADADRAEGIAREALDRHGEALEREGRTLALLQTVLELEPQRIIGLALLWLLISGRR